MELAVLKFRPLDPCPVTPLKRVWPHPLDSLPRDFHMQTSFSDLFLLVKQAQHPLPFLIRERLLSHKLLCRLPVEFCPGIPCLSCPKKPRTGHSTMDVPHQG